jgi:hypothetical protein
MIVLRPLRFNARRRTRGRLARLAPAPACPSRNLTHGPQRGGALFLRGLAGAEGKDDGAP